MSGSVLVAASHGTSDAVGQRAVAELILAVADSREDIDVVGSFVDVQQPDVPTTLAGLGFESPVVIVPLLLSAGYHVRVDLARDAREAEHPEVTVAAALGPDERITRVLARRLRESGLRDEDVVVVAAAGSTDHRAVFDCQIVGEQLAAVLKRPVTVGFISAAEPRLSDAVQSARIDGHRVVVASYLLAPGYFARLVHEGGADLVSPPLLSGDSVVPPELVETVVDRYQAACDRNVSSPLQRLASQVTTS